ncbi:MAG: sulfotransferase [Halobacteria archaeon]|nr:sulfotransferase [Halobacteria archaeon]
MTEPIILFSLPRSGSTLLQRILSVDSNISTVAEPWVLLPHVYALRDEGVFAEYSHRWSSRAQEDLLGRLPRGKQDYLECLGGAMTALYAKLSDEGARYFLDKTPRYALIADEVVNMFGGGKFIFLWRNPLAVVSSMIETWGDGKWNIYIYKVDLFDGLERLIDVYRANSEITLAVQYEALLQAPEQELERVMHYLGLEQAPAMLDVLPETRLSGVMGDPTGVEAYQSVSTHPIDKWKSTINNPLRRSWCRRYLQWIGQERLAVMGYDLDELLEEINATRTDWLSLFGDIPRFAGGVIYCLFDVQIIRQKLAGLSDWKRMKRYS